MAAAKARWPRRLALAVAGLIVLLGVAWLALRTPDIPVATLRAKYGSAASQYVQLAPGTVVHLRDEGPRTGLPVVLMHGSNASLQTWEPWVQRLTARGYRVVTFDFPAHGLSGPVPSRDYSNDAYVGIAERVVDHLALKRFALGGNSMGGGVAWRYAVRHPGRLAALILIDASGQPVPKGQDLPLGFRIARTPLVRGLVASVTPRAIIDRSLRQSVSVQAIVTPAMVDRYWELLRYPGTREATLDRFAGYKHTAENEGARLKTLQVPTLILWGREDRLIPVGSAAWFSQQLPNARVTILDDVGHIPMEEAPDRSLAPVLALLDEVSASRTPG